MVRKNSSGLIPDITSASNNKNFINNQSAQEMTIQDILTITYPNQTFL